MKIVCLKNGPILLQANQVIINGEVKDGPIALCRCGLSSNKPFCDGSHKPTFVGEQVEIEDGIEENEIN